MWVLAQTLQEGFWTSEVGQVVGFIGTLFLFAGTVAAGLKGVSYMRQQGIVFAKATKTRRDEARRVERVLAEITDDEGWPNGSDSLMESHRNLYAKVTKLEEADVVILTHITDLQAAVEQVIINTKE